MIRFQWQAHKELQTLSFQILEIFLFAQLEAANLHLLRNFRTPFGRIRNASGPVRFV